MSLIRSHILVCTGTGCSSSESPKIIAEFEKQLALQGMDKEAKVVRTGCFGLCALGPIVTIYPEGACYTHVTVDDVEEIVSEHIVKGRIVQRLLNKNGGEGPATSLAETNFYKHQFRIALRNCGIINPESIDEYIGVGGYEALGKILTEKIPPQQVIDTVLASGLRGRYEGQMEHYAFQNALSEIFKVIGRANKYIDETAPWALAKDEANRDKLEGVLYRLLEVIRYLGVLLQPFLPDTAEKIFTQIGSQTKTLDSLNSFGAEESYAVGKAEPLFARIDEAKKLAELEEEAKAKAPKEEKKEEETVFEEKTVIE